MRFIVTLGIASFARSASRDKKSPPDMSKFVNRQSKCTRIASVSMLLQPSQSEKTRLWRPSPSRKSDGRKENSEYVTRRIYIVVVE
jgi:hypothetical protein